MAFDGLSYCPFAHRENLRALGETTGPRWEEAVLACDCAGADDADEDAELADLEHRDRMIACGREDHERLFTEGF